MKPSLIILFIFISLNVFSQYRGNNWAIPDSTGINFNTTTPSLFNTHNTSNGCINTTITGNPLLNTSTISDENGQLLFYFNSYNIFNSENNVIENGDSILSDFSISNGSLFLPLPESDSLYFLIYLNSAPFNPKSGMLYSVINKNDNNSNGAIYQDKKNLIAFHSDSISVQLTAVRHANGRDWWILARRYGQYQYVEFLLTPSGLEFIGQQDVGFYLNGISGGCISFNRKGNQIAANYTQAHKMEIISFDRCTGLLFSPLIFDTDPFESGIGICFSPNSKLLYFNSSFDTLKQISGIDGTSSISIETISTEPYLNSVDINGFAFFQMQLAPDNKIYISIAKTNFPDVTYNVATMNLSTIENPDVGGIGCNFQLSSFSLGGKRNTGGLPNMPNYNLGKLEGSACDTLDSTTGNILQQEILTRVYPNPAKDILTIEILNGIKPKSILITDITGRVIKEINQTRPTLQLNISDYASGVYLIKIIAADGNMIAKKFVKE